jgi:hypothetical protein
MHELARAYNAARGSDTTIVSWSSPFMTARVSAAVLRYLAVAHFGRGRGEYVQSEYPHHWVGGGCGRAAGGRSAAGCGGSRRRF